MAAVAACRVCSIPPARTFHSRHQPSPCFRCSAGPNARAPPSAAKKTLPSRHRLRLGMTRPLFTTPRPPLEAGAEKPLAVLAGARASESGSGDDRPRFVTPSMNHSSSNSPTATTNNSNTHSFWGCRSVREEATARARTKRRREWVYSRPIRKISLPLLLPPSLRPFPDVIAATAAMSPRHLPRVRP